MSNIKKVGWALFAKASLLTAIVLTYSYHTSLKKIDYSLFEKKAPIEQYFYQNPPILDIEWKSNNNGRIETYIVNKETKKQIDLMYDMMPKNSEMLETMVNRLRDGYKEEGFELEQLEQVFKQYECLDKQNSHNLWDKVVEQFQRLGD